jgi:tRNA pseudouridine13 synthase
MARSSSLSEAEAGISCYASSHPGFRGVLKHRYSDFIVHEVARDGTVVQLTSFDLPTEVSGLPCNFEFTFSHLRSQSRVQMWNCSAWM